MISSLPRHPGRSAGIHGASKRDARASSTAGAAQWTPAQGRGDGTETGEAGFSLIEAMVALAVLAIASVGLMRAVESHIDSTRGLERRAIAMWVAENRLAEFTLRDPDAALPQVEMLGQAWRVKVDETGTDDPDIHKVHITVSQGAETAPLASLDGFVDGRPA